MTTLPAWLDPLPDASAQRALDQWAIEQRGIAGLELMERAATGLAQLVSDRVPEGTIAIVCGRGNNGGDGLAAARILRNAGREVDVQLICDPGELQGDARVNLERLPGPPPRPFNPGTLLDARGVVDAILGTGASGAPRGLVADAIDSVALAYSCTCEVIACDVPSGVDASTGAIAGTAVRAHATATFHAGKPGLWLSPGKDHAGEVAVVPIGIPVNGRPAEGAARMGLIDGSVLDELPTRGAGATKFEGGSVLVCGGSTGLTGAPSLASEAAMRAGAGYVTALVSASLHMIFEQRLVEVMSVPLPDEEGTLVEAALEPALARCERADALVLGPGLSRDAGAFARAFAAQAPVPLLLDADGLNAHAGQLGLLAARSHPTVLTPHGGELARLLGVGNDEVRGHRLALARRAAREANAVVVLKGDDTIVAQPDPHAPVAISRGGAAVLATAGTGDVLSGVIGALLARGVEPFTAACAGVELHRRAGRLVAERQGVEGAIARDVIEALPHARAARP